MVRSRSGRPSVLRDREGAPATAGQPARTGARVGGAADQPAATPARII